MNGEFIKAGYLTKSPPDKSRRVAQWHKRWFLLADSRLVYPLAPRYVRLEYYKNEEEAKRLADPIGVIKLSECSKIVHRESIKGHKFVFDVCTHDRVYHLAAESIEEKQQWIGTLNRVLSTGQMEAAPRKAQERRSPLHRYVDSRLSSSWNVQDDGSIPPLPFQSGCEDFEEAMRHEYAECGKSHTMYLALNEDPLDVHQSTGLVEPVRALSTVVGAGSSESAIGSDKVEMKDQLIHRENIETEDQHMEAGTTTKQQVASVEEIKLLDLDRELSETNSWVHLGLYLGLPKYKLDEIHADYGIQGLGRCKLEMLSSVLDWQNGTLSWATVVDAVSKTGNSRIAKKIADKHGVHFTATVDAVSPVSEENTELQLLKEKVQAISQMLETGETLFQACSKKKLQLEGDFTEAQQNHELAQKHINMLVEDKRMFQQKLQQREKQIEYLQSKQLEYERTISGLEVKLAGASENLKLRLQLKDKLKRLKEQKQNLVDDIASNKSEIDRLCKKKDKLKQKLDKSKSELSDAESQLKLKNDELSDTKKQVEHLKAENDKLLEQLKKQEKDTDEAIVSYSMSQPAEKNQYENLKIYKWVEEMEKALLEKDAHILELEREDMYTNTSKVGLRAEMERMEEEIQKLKGKVQGPLPKDVSPQAVGTISLATAATGSSMMYHPPLDKQAPDRSTLNSSYCLSTGLPQQTCLPTD